MIKDIGGVNGLLQNNPAVTKGGATGGDGAAGFADLLKSQVATVNEAMQEADQAATGLVTGQHANIHETMIALEKANVSFRLMTKIQGKVISAYQEIMRMQL
ncbi:MAG: flagellar hook-basal body complex protein FliE [Proteobacteria bacterium]|nr:flagellar hook-basal body complex protein FliE [Pseudomonadota bacterium]MBU1737326.1 flagellar hook-basal body complex protein FliE [Pseudomonadota bacterium]